MRMEQIQLQKLPLASPISIDKAGRSWPQGGLLCRADGGNRSRAAQFLQHGPTVVRRQGEVGTDSGPTSAQLRATNCIFVYLKD